MSGWRSKRLSAQQDIVETTVPTHTMLRSIDWSYIPDCPGLEWKGQDKLRMGNLASGSSVTVYGICEPQMASELLLVHWIPSD